MHVRDERSVYWKDQSRALLRGYSGADSTHYFCSTYDRITVVRILSWVTYKLSSANLPQVWPLSHSGRYETKGVGPEETILTKFFTRKTGAESMRLTLIAEPCCQGIFVPVTKFSERLNLHQDWLSV